MRRSPAASLRIGASCLMAASIAFAPVAVTAAPAVVLALTGPAQMAQADAQAPAQPPAANESPAAPAAPSATEQAPSDPAPSSSKAIATPGEIRASGNVEIVRDLSKLPEPVAKLRESILEAAATGDIEKLRPLIAFDPAQMQVGAEGDAIEAVKSLSGDPDGLEIMAIMMDLLQPGAAHINIGKPDEMYVWPYFVGKPLNSLTAPEKIELLRIVTAGDLMAMEEGNNYNFYRIGITPDGKWKLFAGGD
ncbi:hypothetical protein ACFSE1_12065 [Rhizobium helianthi]|uniref:Alanine and proline-rich secreted protein Apa n=1 Tax=Rhizobium helianthi TaxID=1132695 RepID=A0ABW4M4Q1_9HYPH